jgi:hypothetical protein
MTAADAMICFGLATVDCAIWAHNVITIARIFL